MPCSSSAAAISANANTNVLNRVIKDSEEKLCNEYLLNVNHIQPIPKLCNCLLRMEIYHISLLKLFFSKTEWGKNGPSLILHIIDSFCSFYTCKRI